MRAYIRSFVRQLPLTLMGFAGRFLISASSCKLPLTVRFDQPRSDLSFHHLLIACATGGSRIAMLTSPVYWSTWGPPEPISWARSISSYRPHASCAQAIRVLVSAVLTPLLSGSQPVQATTPGLAKSDWNARPCARSAHAIRAFLFAMATAAMFLCRRARSRPNQAVV